MRKEFLLLLRDPRMRFFIIIPPLIQLVIFGYAATFDVRSASIGVVDSAAVAETRQLSAAISATGHYRLQYFQAMADVEQAMAIGHLPICRNRCSGRPGLTR